MEKSLSDKDSDSVPAESRPLRIYWAWEVLSNNGLGLFYNRGRMMRSRIRVKAALLPPRLQWRIPHGKWAQKPCSASSFWLLSTVHQWWAAVTLCIKQSIWRSRDPWKKMVSLWLSQVLTLPDWGGQEKKRVWFLYFQLLLGGGILASVTCFKS